MDEFFPEYAEVFKCPLSGKASRHILKNCPFPKFILALGEDGVTDEIRKAVRKTVGRKKAVQLVETAKDPIGVDYGEGSERLKLRLMLEELELLEKQTEELKGGDGSGAGEDRLRRVSAEHKRHRYCDSGSVPRGAWGADKI